MFLSDQQKQKRADIISIKKNILYLKKNYNLTTI